jgi:arylsulfatase A-like enzyme
METHAKDYVRRFFNAHDTAVTELPDYAYSDNWTGDNALAILETFCGEDKPWFLQVNFPGPHNPWDVTEAMQKRWRDVDFPLPWDCSLTAEEAVGAVKIRRNYAAMLENIDTQIGRILARLKELGEYENTLIVYSSDHGEMLGDKKRYFKSVPYQGAVHIPLIMAGPDIEKGSTCDELAQLHDLAAVFAEYGGGKMPAGNQALSLLPFAEGGKGSLREYQASALSFSPQNRDHPDYEEFSLYDKSRSSQAELMETFREEFGSIPGAVPETAYKFNLDWSLVMTKTRKLIIFNSDSRKPELYDLVRDPQEKENIADNERETVTHMAELVHGF